jgi:hypothetical protein
MSFAARTALLGYISKAKLQDVVSADQTAVSFHLLHFPTHPQNGRVRTSARQHIVPGEIS